MKPRITRRNALRLGAAASALPLVHIRTAGAAGKLNVALWDHWVPAGNEAMRKLVAAWADKNKVEVNLDFLTAIGNKINITMAAEVQATIGHDIYASDKCTSTPTRSTGGPHQAGVAGGCPRATGAAQSPAIGPADHVALHVEAIRRDRRPGICRCCHGL